MVILHLPDCLLPDLVINYISSFFITLLLLGALPQFTYRIKEAFSQFRYKIVCCPIYVRTRS